MSNGPQEHDKIINRSLSPSNSDSSDLSSSSSDSELDLDSDDGELDDILQKYYESDDCSDLTEVSPLSSLATSPVPTEPEFAPEPGGDEEEPSKSMADMNLAENQNQNNIQLEGNGRPVNEEEFWELGKPQYFTFEEHFTDSSSRIAAATEISNGDLSNSLTPSLNNDDGQTSSSETSWNMSPSPMENQDWTRSQQLSSASSASTSSRNSGKSRASTGKKTAKNYTFTPDQVKRIERENHILLRKILDTNRNKNGVGHSHRHKPQSPSSTSITRMRSQFKIEQENNALMKRIQSVKPSKEIKDAFGNPTQVNK